MEKLQSLSILVGGRKCNANCAFCAGKPLRKYAPKKDGDMNWDLVKSTLEKCSDRGASYLSLSSSGEPTLYPISVTKILELVADCGLQGRVYRPVNLYTNGIRIGYEEDFSKKYFPLWKKLGLSTVYLTVHSINEQENAKVYGVSSYPALSDVFSRIKESGFAIRTNLVLNRGVIDSLEKFVYSTNRLMELGSDSISAWPLRDKNDFIDLDRSPDKNELNRISNYVNNNSSLNLRMIFEEKPTHYHSSKKLSLFPDGSLASSWCNR